MKKVAIITINLNQKKLVLDFIEELKKQTYQDFQLYIVDNGSNPDKRLDSEISGIEWISYLDAKANLGFAGGNNFAIEEAKKNGHELVWIINNDVRLDPKCLESLVILMDNFPDIGMVGPKIYYESDRERVWYAGGKIDWSHPYPYSVCTHIGERVIDNKGEFDKTIETDFVTGASMLIRMSVLDQVKGFDERYFVYFEDAALSLKIHQAGHRVIFYPNALMWHMVGVFSGITSPRSSYYQIRNSLFFVKTWGTLPSKILALLSSVLILLKNLVKYFIPTKREFARAQIRAVIDFYTGKLGGPRF